MMPGESHVELLLGRHVLDPDGTDLGKLEEIRAVARDGELRVSQYLVGHAGIAARLTTATLLRRVLHLVRLGTRRRGYLIPWSWMDLSEPGHPRCTHRAAELTPIADEEPPYRPRGRGWERLSKSHRQQ